jgi:hypothetical protein
VVVKVDEADVVVVLEVVVFEVTFDVNVELEEVEIVDDDIVDVELLVVVVVENVVDFEELVTMVVDVEVKEVEDVEIEKVVVVSCAKYGFRSGMIDWRVAASPIFQPASLVGTLE